MDFLVLLAAGMVEREEMRRKKPRREKEGSGAIVAEKEEKGERGLENYKNAPSSISFPNYSILGTTSLICNPNSKPNIDNTTFHWLFTPENI